MGLELKLVSRAGLLGTMARQFGVEEAGSHEEDLSIALVAAVLRRIAASMCPCPRETIISTATEAFIGLGDMEATKACVCDVLDRLVVVGDLLELGGTSTLPSVAADDWLYCAPPTFVVLEELILVLGVEAEDQATLPVPLRHHLQCRRELRVLQGENNEAVREQLLDAGYLEISKGAWTRLPQDRPAEKFLDQVIRRLEEFDGKGQLEGLKVVGLANGWQNYASRWTAPEGQSGHFVGRRPQAFGSPLWVFVELELGFPKRFLDLPWRGGKFRGCDHGWRIQSALDALSGKPQTYRLTPRDGDTVRYEFFSPLPLWAERHLRTRGERVAANGALFAYELARQFSHDIDDLLQSYMWFKQVNQGE
ncbi:hypothetical protein [Luteimonas sp. A478]